MESAQEATADRFDLARMARFTIHLVRKPGGTFDVLDGQQRLTAIRDFIEGQFPVKGDIEPQDQRIQALDGLRYKRLPEEIREEFDTFAIRVFELRDYNPDEPHELFFRLNQPTNLTEAEERNAFMGDSRNQVRDLVLWSVQEGLSHERVGFLNARMSYDDLLARLLLTLERGTLTLKITSAQTLRVTVNSVHSMHQSCIRHRSP